MSNYFFKKLYDLKETSIKLERDVRNINSDIRVAIYEIKNSFDKYNLPSYETFYHQKKYYFNLFDVDIDNKKIILKCYSEDDLINHIKSFVGDWNLDEIREIYSKYSTKFYVNNIEDIKNLKNVMIPINKEFVLNFFYFYEFDFDKINEYLKILKEKVSSLGI
ncbi:hypothetical protein I3I24_000932 [Campylobacter jejuni]|nr:hypothetical protein [Campylobacter jejuni]